MENSSRLEVASPSLVITISKGLIRTRSLPSKPRSLPRLRPSLLPALQLPLYLLPVIALGGLVYLVPSLRRQGISLIWWAITLGLSPLGWRQLVRAYCHTRPGLFREARALLLAEGHRCWVLSASPRALVRAQLYQQLSGTLPHRTLGSRMHYRLGGLMPIGLERG